MLLEHLLKDIAALPKADSTTSIQHTQYIRALILEKSKVLYISDGDICIQALMLLTNKEAKRDDIAQPFNRIKTTYYNFTPKIAKCFNF